MSGVEGQWVTNELRACSEGIAQPKNVGFVCSSGMHTLRQRRATASSLLPLTARVPLQVHCVQACA